jgi:SAM-dependent methyltransferase
VTGDGFRNVYDDRERAGAYASLEFPNTYWLAYRDLPGIVRRFAPGRRALDFGCGAGRSTRFLRGLGFEVTGVDIAEEMLARARQADPQGDYRRIPDGDADGLEAGAYDLVLSVFTFDNVPSLERKVALLAGLRRRLSPGGRIVSLVSSTDIYVNEWASFSTREFAGNFTAGDGDTVYTRMLDVADRRPVADVRCSDECYREVYRRVGLEVLGVFRPLGREDEPFAWVSETRVAPWVIWALGEPGSAAAAQ